MQSLSTPTAMILLVGILGVSFFASIRSCHADELVCPDHSQFQTVLDEGKRVLERSSMGSRGYPINPRSFPLESHVSPVQDVQDSYSEVQNNLPPSETELSGVRVVTPQNIETAIDIAIRCTYSGMFDEAITILDQVAPLARAKPERSAWISETLGALHALKGMPWPFEKPPLSRQFCDVSRDRLLMLDSLSRNSVVSADLFRLVSQTELQKAKSMYLQALQIHRQRHEAYVVSFDLINLATLRHWLREPPNKLEEAEVLQIEGNEATPTAGLAKRLTTQDFIWLLRMPHPRMTNTTLNYIVGLAHKRRLNKVEAFIKSRHAILAATGSTDVTKSQELISIGMARRYLRSSHPETSIPIYNDLVAEISKESTGTDIEASRRSLFYVKTIITDVTPKAKSSQGLSLLYAKAVAVQTNLSQRIAKLECLKLADELNDTGFKLEKAEQYKSARKMYEASLKIKVINLGMQDRCTATQLVDLARLSAEEGLSDVEVKKLYEQALAIFRQKPQHDDAEFRAALENYASFLGSKNENSKSEILYAEARKLSE